LAGLGVAINDMTTSWPWISAGTSGIGGTAVEIVRPGCWLDR